jgi:hypothetical protein
VLESVRREPAPTQAQTAARRLAIGVAGFVPAVALVATLAHHGDYRPVGYVVFVACTWASVATLATWLALRMGRSMLGVARIWLVAATLTVPPALAALAGAATAIWPQTNVVDSDVRAHALCFVLTTVVALGPVLAFALLRRESDPVHPRWTGALIGAASGACGATAVALHCGHTYPVHVLVGHVLPVILVTLVGVFFASHVVAVGGKPPPADVRGRLR